MTGLQPVQIDYLESVIADLKADTYRHDLLKRLDGVEPLYYSISHPLKSDLLASRFNAVEHAPGGVKPNVLAVSGKDYISLITNANGLFTFFTANSNYHEVEAGLLGTMLGMTVVTDAMFIPPLRYFAPLRWALYHV